MLKYTKKIFSVILTVVLSSGKSVFVNLHSPPGPITWRSNNSKVATVKFVKAFYDENAREVISRAKITLQKSPKINIWVSNSKVISVKAGSSSKNIYVTIKGLKVGKATLKIRYKNGKIYTYIINVKK